MKLKKYKCKFCKEHFEMTVEKYSQRSMTSLKGVCTSEDCMTEAAMKVIVEKKAMEKRKWNQRKKDGLESCKTISDWKKDLQDVINWIVKKIDEDYPCISHPEMVGFLRYDAGHYFSVKAHSDLRFNLHNIHKQNSQANELYGGCPEYTIGLMNRYGTEYSEMVLSLPLKYKGIGKEKYKIKHIKTIYLPKARDIKRRLEKGEKLTRDQINYEIGIY